MRKIPCWSIEFKDFSLDSFSIDKLTNKLSLIGIPVKTSEIKRWIKKTVIEVNTSILPKGGVFRSHYYIHGNDVYSYSISNKSWIKVSVPKESVYNNFNYCSWY